MYVDKYVWASISAPLWDVYHSSVRLKSWPNSAGYQFRWVSKPDLTTMINMILC